MKFKTNTFIILFLVVLSFIPFVTFGEVIPQPSSNTASISDAPESTGDFCSNLIEINKKIKSQIIKAEEKQSVYEASRDTIIGSKETEADSKLSVSRTLIESERINNWDKMVNNAKTDEQKDAVISYQARVQIAVNIRRAAEDEAINTYREGLAKIISAHTDTITKTIALFKTVLNTALINAYDDCEKKLPSPIAEDNFIKKINEAKDVLTIATQNNTTKTDILKLKSARDDAIKSAEEVFKSSVDKAQDDLVVALDK